MTDTDPAEVAAAYFEAWRTKDFRTLRSLLADGVDFVGPLATVAGADACAEGIERMSQITTDIVVRKRFVDDPDVLTWLDLHTTIAPPSPTANWMHVEGGRISSIRVAFDARPFAS